MSTKDFHDDRSYFAAAPIEEIGDRLSGRVSDYYSYLTSSALVDLWRRSYYSYYGLLEDTALSGFGIFAVGRIRASGMEGELANVKVNHFRNLLTHILVLTTQQRQALKSRAINSDSESLSQAHLGDGLVDYYFRERKIEQNNLEAVETALVFGESFVRLDWDETEGEEFASQDGRIMHEGDITCKTYHPFDVVRDTTHQGINPAWYIFHDAKNRYDLAAKYPIAADKILNISTDITSGKRYVDPTKIIPAAGVGTKHTDLIDIYEFCHKKTASVPGGRYTIFLQDGTVLFDGTLPFKDIPVYRLAAANIIGTPFGYTVAFDILGIQALIDKLYTVVSSNQLAGGIQNFWQPPGNQLTKMEVAGGLNLLESVIKPEVLELCKTPAEVFTYIQRLETIMEMLCGISAVNRGATPENLKSGSALAFAASQAVTFMSGLEKSFVSLQEGVGTGVLHILRDFVQVEKQAVIAGKFNRPIVKRYSGQGLQKIDRVVMEVSSAMSKTHAGKLQIAQDLLGSGLIRNAREYISVVSTGEIESLYESEMSEIILVKAENEDMRDGKQPIALIIDDHKLHFLEHRSILANPEARLDPNLVQIVLAHTKEHIDMIMQLQQTNPALLALMGEQPLPIPMMPAQPQIPGQAPQAPQGNLPAMANAQTPAAQAQENVRPTRMPNLPAGADQNSQESYGKLQQ